MMGFAHPSSDIEYIERRQYISDAIEQGIGYAEIGRNMGLSRERIRQIVDEERIPRSRLSWGKARERMVSRKISMAESIAARRAKTYEKYKPVIDDVLAGSSIKAAAYRHGMSQPKANEYLRRHGIKSSFKKWGHKVTE